MKKHIVYIPAVPLTEHQFKELHRFKDEEGIKTDAEAIVKLVQICLDESADINENSSE